MSPTLSPMSVYARRKRRQKVAKGERLVKASKAHQPRKIRRRGIRPAIIAVHRTVRVLHPDTRVRYADPMPERRVDRVAWAGVIGQLIADEAGDNKSEFARIVGVTYKTVTRWLDPSKPGEVPLAAVIQVADAMHISPISLMLRVGYLHDADLPTPPQLELAAAPAAPVAPDAHDEPMQAILNAKFPPRIKMRMAKRLEALREEQRRRELDDVRWWLDQAQGA